MALIDPNHPAANLSPRQFWQEELNNCLTLLDDVNKRIHELDLESYSLNTGQNVQSVNRSNLTALCNHRDRLLKQIAEYQALLGIGIQYGPIAVQVVPF
jgi:hypothetical protein